VCCCSHSQNCQLLRTAGPQAPSCPRAPATWRAPVPLYICHVQLAPASFAQVSRCRACAKPAGRCLLSMCHPVPPTARPSAVFARLSIDSSVRASPQYAWAHLDARACAASRRLLPFRWRFCTCWCGRCTACNGRPTNSHLGNSTLCHPPFACPHAPTAQASHLAMAALQYKLHTRHGGVHKRGCAWRGSPRHQRSFPKIPGGSNTRTRAQHKEIGFCCFNGRAVLGGL
jgi:hypothetical protein